MWYFKIAIAVLAMLIGTWLLFGPVDGFHHVIQYGFFGYMISGSEDADPGDFVLYGERFWFFPDRFVISVVFWIGMLTLIWFVILRNNTENSKVTNP